ncbi:hypothetical protein [Halogeometricum luteum]|uniref:Major facilitator superfamily (MFS) profile domain-containing protein n=1 Tax=Halogeometricum luteum TaxID=2950537 RepID=A0ABU2FYX4_9EURY|nr:hypothetical protein [Halogeometricum sp. S3BR5-2]MDS0293732.1 hypothetical protein [Halogeometricum sp. S3BR5-2]
MAALLANWRSDVFRLALVGVFTAAAVVTSYNHVAATGSTEAVLAITGAGLLLALLVIVPAFLANRN